MRSVTGTLIAPARPRTVAAVLLERRATVYLPPGSGAPSGEPSALAQAGVTLLEADLLERGYLMSVGLREHLLGLVTDELTVQGMALLADIDAAVGGARPMVPQFRGFPASVPADTMALWVDRVLACLFQYPEQPCVLCGTEGSVHAVSPCGHLVCQSCFDGRDYAGCPICHRRIDPDDPFLRPAEPRTPLADIPLPARARVLSVGTDSAAAARSEVDTLLARSGALSPADSADLVALLAAFDPDDLTWLPAEIPARETKATVLAWLVRERAGHPEVWAAIAARLGTATDALRLLVTHSGGDAGLVQPPRFGPVPRPLRRTILAALDRLDGPTLVEDLRRYRPLWIHAAERLHPFEYGTVYPRAAAGFAILRGSVLTGDRLGTALVGRGGFEVLDSDRSGPYLAVLRSPSLGGQVEAALSTGDTATALAWLRTRPGELVRRLDHLLRLGVANGTAPTVVAAARAAAPAVAPAVLLGALGELRVRDQAHRRRVFFPKGGAARAHVVADERSPLPGALVSEVEGLLTAELLARAGRLPAVETAVIDRSLGSLTAPFTQRSTSRALVTLPRGSAITIPAGQFLRLFLHWMESDQRVDLDLSAAFFDGEWNHIGTCDYTQLRFAEQAAVHSGDFTSAPPPDGAAEFLDLDADALAAAGVRYVVVAVFSYNNVAFDDMAEAFAGVMVRAGAPEAGAVFEPRTVEQRFDLGGRSRASVPFVYDLAGRELRWLDMTQGVTGTLHAVHVHASALAVMGQSLDELYRSGARIGLGELATWEAAARAGTVYTRFPDGRIDRYDRRSDEDATGFAARIAGGEPDAVGVAIEAPVPLAFLDRADVPVADGAEVYAVHRRGLSADAVRLLAAEDLTARLSPVDGS